MHVLIVAKTRQEYETTVRSYDRAFDAHNEYHWITSKEQIRGYQMPVQIRFIGTWAELPDAPTLEAFAQIITGSPVKTDGQING